MASLLRRIGRAAGQIARSPIGKVAGLVPGLGTAVNAIGLAGTAYTAYSGARALISGGGGGAPTPPGFPSMGGAGPLSVGPMFDPNMGKRSIFRDDPNVSEQLKPYAIDDRFLRTYHRAPKGFVVLHDAKGDAFAIPKKIAQAHGMWKPAAKPPISVRDWHHLQGAGRVVKKFRDMEKVAMRIANFHAHRGSGQAARMLNTIAKNSTMKALAKAAG